MKYFHKYKAFYPYFLSFTALKQCSFQQQHQVTKDHAYYMKQAEVKAGEYIKWFMVCHGIPGLSYSISLGDGTAPTSSSDKSFGFTNVKLPYRDFVNKNLVDNQTLWNIGGITTLATTYLMVYRGHITGSLRTQVNGDIPMNSILIRNKSFGTFKAAIANPNRILHMDGVQDITNNTLRVMENNWLSGFVQASYGYPQGGYTQFVEDLKNFYRTTTLNFRLSGEILHDLTNIASGHHSESEQDHEDRTHTIKVMEGGDRYDNARRNNLQADTMKLYGAFDVYATARDLAKLGRTLIDTYNNGRLSAPTNQRSPSPPRGNSIQPIPIKHNILAQIFDSAGTNLIKHNMDNDDGRLRLGWTPCYAVNRVPELENYGTVDFQGQQFFISSEIGGFSSILLMKGIYPKGVHPSQQDKQRRDKTSVAVLCNLDNVTLYELADRIAAIYEEQERLFYDKR